MSKKVIYLIAIIITILVGISLFASLCGNCLWGEEVVQPVEKDTVPPPPMPTSFPLAITSGTNSSNESVNAPNLKVHNSSIFDQDENYNFKKSSWKFERPLSPYIIGGIAEFKSILSQNEKKILSIIGYYTSEETNTSAFPDLGLARANSVKNHLVSKGIKSSQINTGSKLLDAMVPRGDVFLGPVEYGLVDLDEHMQAILNAVYKSLQENPLILHFETNQARISLTLEQRQKFAAIAKYLDKVEGAHCTVVGHTDNVGRRETNVKLGLERANFGKAYLILNGIPQDRIDASSKGPDEPIESNDTDEGRSKNRRTVITLKNPEPGAELKGDSDDANTDVPKDSTATEEPEVPGAQGAL